MKSEIPDFSDIAEGDEVALRTVNQAYGEVQIAKVDRVYPKSGRFRVKGLIFQSDGRQYGGGKYPTGVTVHKVTDELRGEAMLRRKRVAVHNMTHRLRVARMSCEHCDELGPVLKKMIEIYNSD